MDKIPPAPINNQLESISVPSPVIIPSELIAVILSFLPVKIISRFRCVSKSWKTLISDPSFIKMNLQKSSTLNPNFILKPFLHEYPMNNVVSLSVSRLLENPSITLSGNTYRSLLKDDDNCSVVGSCNGLLCLVFTSYSTKHVKFSFRFWNPATGTISEELGFLCENKPILGIFKFTFGCDYLRGTYKLVWLHSVQNRGLWKSNVRVFSLGGNGDNDDDKCCWRNIPSPFICGNGVHLNGTINWLSLREDLSVLGGSVKPLTPHVSFFLIVSLDLSTETYTKLLLPEGFNEVPCAESNLQVLLDCLCFCHEFRKTECVIWQMKEFGVRESWTQLFRIRYSDLQMPNLPIEVQYLDESPLLPLYVSKNRDTVILTNEEDDKAIIYNHRDKRVVRSRTTISNDIHWFSAIDYVESLVPTPWKSGDIDAKTKKDEDESEDEGEAVEGGFIFMGIN